MKHIHWLLPYLPNEDISKADIASARLRAGLFKHLPNYNVTFGYDVAHCDILFVGKVGSTMPELQDLWRDIIARHSNVIFDYTDDHINNLTPMTKFYRDVIKTDSKIVASSNKLKENLVGYTNVTVIPDPYEIPIQAVRANNNKFLWYGHPTNLKYLYNAIQRLQPHNNIILEIMTSEGAKPYIKDTLNNINIHPNVHIEIKPWSIQAMLTNWCANVIIPGDINDPRKNGVANGRLVTAFAMGCAVCATPYDSYLEFKDYFCDMDNINDFINNPSPYYEKTKQAQKLITKYSEEKMLMEWMKLL